MATSRPPTRRVQPVRRRALQTTVQALQAATARAQPRRRLGVFLLIYLLLTAVLGWRLVTVQVVSAGEYRDLAERQAVHEVELPAERGTIYDRRGEPLAISVPAAAIYASPRVIAEEGIDPTFLAADLAPLLDMEVPTLLDRLTADAGFVYLDRQVPRAVGIQIDAMQLTGVGVLSEPKRMYPAGALGSQVIGFAGIDGDGLAGLELGLDDLLAGTPGRLRQEGAPGGVQISSAPREVEPSLPGEDVVLTIDRAVQGTVEQLLDAAVARHGALGASAVVLDVDSGEILAAASSPGFDPTDLDNAEQEHIANAALTSVIEPGSVNKVMTVAAALEEGVLDGGEALWVPSVMTVAGQEFTDAAPRPAASLDVATIMAQSSNVGTILIGERLSHEVHHRYLEAFGLGASAGTRFPAESPGILPPVPRWYGATQATISLGHGASSTLLQTAGVFQTLANDGVRVHPRLVRGVVDADGTIVELDPREETTVVSPATAVAVNDMLREVVERGTGQQATVPGYRVAGKTGTAQKPSATALGYTQDAYLATFAGFAPADAPELAVAVVVDEPEGSFYGGRVAAPLFSEIMEAALPLRRVAPDTP